MKKGRKAQFYLIATVLLILIIFGFVTAVNKAITQPKPVRFYDLSSDYNAETAKVIDYGVYHKYTPPVPIDRFVENITEIFRNNYFQNNPKATLEIAYIYGDKNSLVKASGKIASGNKIELCLEETGSCSGQNIKTITPIVSSTIPRGADSNKTTINLAGNTYEFELKGDEVFYFVIINTLGEETHVVAKD